MIRVRDSEEENSRRSAREFRKRVDDERLSARLINAGKQPSMEKEKIGREGGIKLIAERATRDEPLGTGHWKRDAGKAARSEKRETSELKLRLMGCVKFVRCVAARGEARQGVGAGREVEIPGGVWGNWMKLVGLGHAGIDIDIIIMKRCTRHKHE